MSGGPIRLERHDGFERFDGLGEAKLFEQGDAAIGLSVSVAALTGPRPRGCRKEPDTYCKSSQDNDLQGLSHI